VQAQVLDVLKRIQREFGTAIMMITHDLGVIADMADDVIVMYAGTAMEKSGQHDMFYEHHHPYTEGLLLSLPAYGDERERLQPIQGQPPSLINLPTGCPFHPRCPYVMDICTTDVPPLRQVFGEGPHVSACWLPTDRDGRTAARAALADGSYAGATDASLAGDRR
jgi:oligopeptide/dipeptide ABC transporter ATP-binding protein